MKKLLTVLPVSIVLAACASGPVASQTTETTTKAYDGMAPQSFICEDNSAVNVKYSVDGEQAMLNVNLPKANFANQTMTMNIAQSGSGARYVNNESDNVAYEWHTKGNLGIMGLTWADGSQYSVKCEAR